MGRLQAAVSRLLTEEGQAFVDVCAARDAQQSLISGEDLAE